MIAKCENTSTLLLRNEVDRFDTRNLQIYIELDKKCFFSVLIGLFIFSWNVILFHFVSSHNLFETHNDNLSFLFG